LATEPLNFFHHIKACVHDEGVQLSGFGWKTRDSIASLLRSSKVKLKERIVFRANDTKVIRHDEEKKESGLKHQDP